jgi:5-formyltetrahydrofolate cyclo-ligase
MNTKVEIRREVQARLRSLDPAARAAAGAAIAKRVWNAPEVAAARRLLLYASLPAEVPTDAIADDARRRGIEVIYPRCLPETRDMILHLWEPGQEWRQSAYGIREPDESCPIVTLEDIDAALIPGLAWDRHGGRLGRGAGYYDRLLGAVAWRGFACGLFFAAQEFPLIPMDSWDVRLDAVATETEILNF